MVYLPRMHLNKISFLMEPGSGFEVEGHHLEGHGTVVSSFL